MIELRPVLPWACTLLRRFWCYGCLRFQWRKVLFVVLRFLLPIPQKMANASVMDTSSWSKCFPLSWKTQVLVYIPLLQHYRTSFGQKGRTNLNKHFKLLDNQLNLKEYFLTQHVMVFSNVLVLYYIKVLVMLLLGSKERERQKTVRVFKYAETIVRETEANILSFTKMYFWYNKTKTHPMPSRKLYSWSLHQK